MNKAIFLASAGLAALVGVTTLLGTYYTVDQGEKAIVLTNGAISGDSGPGLHFKVPFVQSVTHISTRQEQENFDGAQGDSAKMQAYSRDQQPATITVSVNWHVIDPVGLYQTYGTTENYRYRIVGAKALEVLKNVFGQFDAADAIQKRALLNARVLSALQASTQGTPGAIDSVQVEDISFSSQYEAAVEARMGAIVAQQQAEAEKSKRMTNADAAKYEKEAQADASLYTAQNEAKGIEAKGQALKDNPQIVALTTAQSWDGHLPATMVPGSSVPFVKVGAQ